MGITSEYEAIITNEVAKKFGKCDSIIKSNRKYLGTFNNDKINIYNLNYPSFNLTVENSISCIEKINNIDFNPEYPQIIMSALNDGDVKLWNISDKANNNKEICIFKGHSSYVIYALFNPEFSNMVISSDKNNIKIWDITKYLHYYDVIHEDKIESLKWNFSGDKYGYIDNNSKLVINETRKNKGLLEIHENNKKDLNDFIFEGYHDIITFQNNRINRWDMRKFDEPVKTYENIDIISYLYDNKLKYLYSNQGDNIDIYKTHNFDNIEQKLKLSLSDNITLLDSCFLENNEIANIFELTKFKSRIIKIKKENHINKQINKQTNMSQPEKSLKEYLNKIVYKISDYSELLKFNRNIKQDEIIISPKYLDISELSIEFKSIQSQTVFQRKQYVQDKIIQEDNIKDIKNSKDKCIFYLRLLIRDNTNIKLIKQYLSFLKRNPQLEALNLDYKKELQFYMVCLSKSELNELKEEKSNDEKNNLIIFLRILYETHIKDYLDFDEQIKQKEINGYGNHSFFNQPIEFENTELFFYKLKMNLYYRITKMNSKDYKANFNVMKDYIKKVLNNNYFNNNYINQNEEILDLLIFSISNINLSTSG